MADRPVVDGPQGKPPFTELDRRALRAVAVQFFVNGALFASFIPRLPEIRDRVGISVAGIGLLMSIAGLTGLVGSAVVGPSIEKFGTRRVMLVSGTIVALSLPVIGIATAPAVLLIGLAGMMSFDVLVDVAMNMQGSWLSARRHAPVINRLHGLWSLGTVIGGVSSSRLASAGVSLSVHLVCASAVLLVVIGYVSRGLLRTDEQHVGELQPRGDSEAAALSGSGVQPRRFQPVLLLFLFAGLFAVSIESTSIDWAAFRLRDDFATTAGFAALAYVAVTGGMTIGRFSGDWATVRFGHERLTVLSTICSGVGIALASLVPNRYVSLAGFVLVGLGVAALLPVLYDNAAKHPGRSGVGLGALTAGLRIASLTVPLIVGTLAATSLSVGSAVAIVTLPSVGGFLLVTALIRRRP